MHGRIIEFKSARRFLLASMMVIYGVSVCREVQAQVLEFMTPQVGDRQVTLRWTAVPSDTLSAAARNDCKAVCGTCCSDYQFGGYQIWRGSSDDTTKLVLMRTYSIFDSTWTFIGENREFSDPDSVIIRGCGGTPGFDTDRCDPLTGRALGPFNGFRYWYAISWFESAVDTVGGPRVKDRIVQDRGTGLRDEPVMPSGRPVAVSPVLGNVRVVPNPYDPSDEATRQSYRGDARIQFINLPSPARVKIFTIAGDLVQTLQNDDLNGSIDWNLQNAEGRDVVPGIYLYVAETGDGSQSRNGHFVIIR